MEWKILPVTFLYILYEQIKKKGGSQVAGPKLCSNLAVFPLAFIWRTSIYSKGFWSCSLIHHSQHWPSYGDECVNIMFKTMAREMGWIGMSEIWMAVLNEDAFTGRQAGRTRIHSHRSLPKNKENVETGWGLVLSFLCLGSENRFLLWTGAEWSIYISLVNWEGVLIVWNTHHNLQQPPSICF